ncbi:RING finger protein 219 [Larimichthys crocea]|uniref:RING finger protein 219 n=1 Tax=Larimichthys crocea TaxID=215358 RepID=A0A6G0J1N2_LARCR|nr:RING finger protein 219 [Larimichthys crocea]
MALNFQSSTLSLTLPISCQICLGKVRQPVICANHHVFCSSCMEMWLKKASQCPTCRVPITADSPCREIIGGTNESDHSDSPSMRKCLRKTRGELLLREYEEEIEGLIRENEELKTKNQSLESQLKTALNPCSINTVQTDDQKVDPEEWTNKLRAARDVCDKVKQDMDKLKEVNKTLRSQNEERRRIVQENMRLKAEVVSRSPQKFGRYTVAALEAKIQQYERDVDHLQRALKRSDHTLKTSSPASENHKPFQKNLAEEQKNVDLESTSSDFLPTTPSSAFRSLTLRSPGIREKKVAFKPVSYLRRLDFEEFPSPSKSTSTVENQFSSLDTFPKDLPPKTNMEPSKSVFWGGWQRSESDEQSCPGPSTESSVEGATSTKHAGDNADSFQMSCEASMDAAYLDKITELDSMMLDGESSSSGDHSSLWLPSLSQTWTTLSSQNHKPVPTSQQATSENLCHKATRRTTRRDNMDDKEAPKGSAEEVLLHWGQAC